MTTTEDMINEARALHERHEHSPQYCGTCGDINTGPVPWPCKTAVALGATGRSEWVPLNGPIRCGAIQNEYAQWPCIMKHGHAGHHLDGNGDTFEETE